MNKYTLIYSLFVASFLVTTQNAISSQVKNELETKRAELQAAHDGFNAAQHTEAFAMLGIIGGIPPILYGIISNDPIPVRIGIAVEVLSIGARFTSNKKNWQALIYQKDREASALVDQLHITPGRKRNNNQ